MKFKLYNRKEKWVYYNKEEEPIEIVGDLEMVADAISLDKDDASEVEIEVWETEPCVGNYNALELKSIEGAYALYLNDNNVVEMVPLEIVQEISDPIPDTLYCDWF